jgi:hypothetical protein
VWYLLRRRLGRPVAGPLWALLFFEVVASFYALAVPPWQMPDEAQHMVHVELVREAGVGPTLRLADNRGTARDNAINAKVEQRVIASAREANVVRLLPGARAPLDGNQVFGPSELLNPPLYYRLAAALTAPFGAAPILVRVALLRTLGVVFGAWTVWACGAVGRLLWPTRPRMAEVPLALAAGIPTFAVFAGSVNNDGPANLLAALFVVGAAWLAGRPTLRRPALFAVAMVALAVVGVFTKRTFVPLVLLVPLALVLRSPRRRTMLLAGAIGAELLAGILLVSAPHTRVALWQGATASETVRCRDSKLGRWAMCLEGSQSSVLTQYVPLARVDVLRNRDVTFGAWFRGNPGAARGFLSMVADDSRRLGRVVVTPTPEWQFVTLQSKVPGGGHTLRVEVGASGGSGRVFADGVVLGAGLHAGPPAAGGRASLRWDGATVRNEVDNGSAERAGLRAPRGLPAFAENGLNGPLDAVDSLVHQPGRVLDSRDQLSHRMSVATAMFWSTVGSNIPPAVLPAVFQLLLGLLGVVGLGGTVAAVALGRLRAAWPLIVLMLVTGVITAGAVVLRDVPPAHVVLVSGRYFFPGLTAAVAILAIGWRVAWPGDDLSLRQAARISVLVLHALAVLFVLLPFLTGGRSEGTELAGRDCVGSTACLSPPSRRTTPRTAPSRPPRSSASRPTSATPRCTTRPPKTGRVSGPGRPSPSTGSTSGTPSSTGSCRSPAGS